MTTKLFEAIMSVYTIDDDFRRYAKLAEILNRYGVKDVFGDHFYLDDDTTLWVTYVQGVGWIHEEL